MDEDGVKSQKEKEKQARQNKKVSKVWNHFKVKKNKDLVQCVNCTTKVGYFVTGQRLQREKKNHLVYSCCANGMIYPSIPR